MVSNLSPEVFPGYGELWFVDLDPAIGAEITGRRPGLIVSNDTSNQYSDTVTILPLTSQPARRQYPYELIRPEGTGNLSMTSRVKANMIRTIDKSRVRSIIGLLLKSFYPQINQILRVHLNIAR